MSWRAQINDRGVIYRYKDADTGEVISAQDYQRRMEMQQGSYSGMNASMQQPGMYSAAPQSGMGMTPVPMPGATMQQMSAQPAPMPGGPMQQMSAQPAPMPAVPMPNAAPLGAPGAPPVATADASPFIQPGAHMLMQGASAGTQTPPSGQHDAGLMPASQSAMPSDDSGLPSPQLAPGSGLTPTAGLPIQGKNLRLEGMPAHNEPGKGPGYKAHGFLDATSIAILLPTLVLLALIIAAAHKKRLFPWQTLRTFNPPSGLMSPRDYERSFLCPPNLRRHGRLGKRNPNATWVDADGVVVPFGFLARTHLPITIPIGRLPNKNMFIVAPSGSGKTTLMRAIIKALLAKPCVIIALEAKANDPNLDEKREGFKYTVLPEAQHAGFETLYFNPLDKESIHWNPLEVAPIVFASSIVQDVNSLPPEEQHWAERDHGYIAGLAQLLKWGAVQVTGEDENGAASRVELLGCNPNGLMRLVNNRRNIVESLRRLKNVPEVPAAELSELTQTLSSIIRTDTDWDKNIQGVRGRLRMFKNPGVLNVTEQSNVDLRNSMHKPTVLIFGAPASLGPDAESLASCFVYQLQQALHTRYGTASVLPLFAFFDEYQTLNMDIAGRLSAIVRGANGGLAVILQNISQVAETSATGLKTGGGSELKTIFSNSAIRVCLHNADETTARFFSDEIGKHAVVVPGISDHYLAAGGIFPTSWNRIHSQQVVARVDPDAIKRMEKHHALVYLSPAGDPEFGETKPLMVDLRGIEEIARLHLLHNVSARRTPPGTTLPPGTLPPGGMPPATMPPGTMPPGTMPAGGMPGPNGPNTGMGMPPGVAANAGAMVAPMFAAAAAAGAASHFGQSGPATPPGAMPQPGPLTQGPATAPGAPRVCSNCGHTGADKKFCIQCGAFMGAPVAASGAESTPSASVLRPNEAPNTVPEPASGTIGHMGQMTQTMYPLTGAPIPQPEYSGTQRPGVVQAQTQTKRAPLFDGPLQIAAAAQQAQTAQRKPMTSFNPDLSRLGLPSGVIPEAPHDPTTPTRHPGSVEF